MKFAIAVFKFFASLHLAIFLLLTLALVFAAGTFVESFLSTEAATLLVYRSPWMTALLILLALNLAAAAFDRLPWKKKHVGFVVTHAGIILLLAGSLITRAYGIEGQMAVAEGETAGRMILSEPLLQIASPREGAPSFFNLPRHALPWQGREALHGTAPPSGPLLEVTLLRFLPKAGRKEEVRETSNGPPALEVVLKSSFMESSHWLVLGDPARERISLGPAELRFAREPLESKKAGNDWGSLEFQFENSNIQVPLDEKLPKKFSLKGTPYHVTVQRILKDAVVAGEHGKGPLELVDQSDHWANPACELLLEGQGIEEKHTVFSNFPDFPTVHGMKPSAAGTRIFYRRAGRESGAKNELRFVWREAGPPLYQIRKGEEIKEGEFRLGEKYPTGWMDFEFRVEKYYPHAGIEGLFSEEPVSSRAEDHLSAIQVELEWQGEKKTFWLGQGDRKTLNGGTGLLEVIYGLRTLPVGFRVQLRDFRMTHDPGTRRPASFESDVTLLDDSTGLVKETTIRMNRPLKYRGFKVFQSGYQQPEGGTEVSIFTVAKDPGIPVKYAGAIVLIGGILTMFYSKRFSNQDKKSAERILVSR